MIIMGSVVNYCLIYRCLYDFSTARYFFSL